MGIGRLIKTNERDGYMFISDKGVEYDLFEGKALDGSATSDIVFIMLHDKYDENGNIEIETEYVDFLYGASCITLPSTDYLKEEMEMAIQRCCYKFEREHPGVVKYYEEKRESFMLKEIEQTISHYLSINREVIDEYEIRKLKKQIEYIEKLRKEREQQ